MRNGIPAAGLSELAHEIKQHPEPLLKAGAAASYRGFITKAFETPAFYHSLPLAAAGINPELTPSQLTGEQWAKLFTKL